MSLQNSVSLLAGTVDGLLQLEEYQSQKLDHTAKAIAKQDKVISSILSKMEEQEKRGTPITLDDLEEMSNNQARLTTDGFKTEMEDVMSRLAEMENRILYEDVPQNSQDDVDPSAQAAAALDVPSHSQDQIDVTAQRLDSQSIESDRLTDIAVPPPIVSIQPSVPDTLVSHPVEVQLAAEVPSISQTVVQGPGEGSSQGVPETTPTDGTTGPCSGNTSNDS